ncbi:hypothetical protein [Sphingobacterium daejeonense]|uniref:hypothetical protein n=1 Tax=Sphingobacterium daejeonense TaxID=371142 RepID=UPI0010C4B024|nr:hypothetical protein [Sphingobacterium daejeonense]VTP89807.1 Uncharacterised protein [Sphingobacterium daejeonense]
MNFKIGDLVRFVDEPIEGHITAFLQNGLVGVTDDTGFEIPVMLDKITLVHGNMRMEEDEEPTTIAQTGKFIEKGIFLALTGEQKDGLVKFFIVNETSFELMVSVTESIGNKKNRYLCQYRTGEGIQPNIYGKFCCYQQMAEFGVSNFKNI